MPDKNYRIVWDHENNREFLVKKLTRLLIDGGDEDSRFAFEKI